MDFQEYVNERKQIQSSLLAFIDQASAKEEENFQNLTNLIQEQQIAKDKDELTAFFHLISQISAHHHRTPNFHTKLDRVISIFADDIRENFLNLELFHIFKKNKRILLYLIQNDLIFLDENIAKVLSKPKYRKLRYIHYFYPELKKYLTDEKLKNEIEKDISKYNDDTFKQLRQHGENETKICELIRNDAINEFTSQLSSDKRSQDIPISIFETNTFLIKNGCSMIEYSAFFGSIQIFNYLLQNGSQTSSQIWLYAVHGRNLEIINSLISSRIRARDSSYVQALDESFKCHNGEVTSYIKEKLLNVKSGEELSVFAQSTKYYNYENFPDDLNNQFTFCYFCQADYYSMVTKLVNLSNKNFKINTPIIAILTSFLFL